jgi:hypothetical protein
MIMKLEQRTYVILPTATGTFYISPQITTINFALISTVIHNIQRTKRTSYEFSLGTNLSL